MSNKMKGWAQKSGLVGRSRRSGDEAGHFSASSSGDNEASSRAGSNRLTKSSGSALNAPLSRQGTQTPDDHKYQNPQAYQGQGTHDFGLGASDDGETIRDDETQSRLSTLAGSYRVEDLQRVVGDVRYQLYELNEAYPQLCLELSDPLNLEQVSLAQRKLIEEFKGVARTNYDLGKQLAADERTRSSMAAEIKRITDELKKSEVTRTTLFNDYNKSKQTFIEQKERAEKDLRKGLEDQLKSHTRAEKALRKEHDEAKKQVEKEAASKWKDHFKFQIDELVQEVNERKRDIDHIKRAAQESERILVKRKDAAYNKLALDRDTDIAIMLKQHEDNQRRTQKNHEAEVANIINTYEAREITTRKKHEAEVANIINDYEAQKISTQQNFEAERSAWARKEEDLKSAIVDQVKKDYFKSMGDGAVSNQFQGISNSIDEFSRVPWETAFEPSWPYPSHAFTRSDNSRRTKQYIIQNTLWIILYDRILRTPFRMLGEEGQDLENQWFDKFQDWNSSGSVCPKPTTNAEKWRYEKIKSCTDAINQKSQNDTKLAHEKWLTDTCYLMCQELEKITQVTSNDRQSMTELVKKAAKLWLEVGQQRYRLYVLMSESGKEPVRGSVPDHDGALSIVVTPGLRRFGNSQGDRLDKEEIVMGCKGKFATEYLAK